MDFRILIEAATTITAYHGGDNPEPHNGMYFSSSLQFAKDYGNVHQYKITLGKMFDSFDENMVDILLPMYDPYNGIDIETLDEYMHNSSDTWEIIEQYLRSIQSMGYDSVRVFEGGVENYYIFDKSNITMLDQINESVDQPTIAYHITTEENADEIMHTGLNPDSDENRIYLITDTKDIPEVRGWIEAKTNDDEQLTMLKIDVSGLPLKYNDGWYYSTQPIAPDRITDLGWQSLQRY